MTQRFSQFWLFGALLLMATLAACSDTPALSEADLTPVFTAVPPTDTPKPLAPPVVSTLPPPPPQQAFVLPSAEELMPTATPTPVATPTPELVQESAEPEPPPTDTPQPTFTPPALPGTSANEHYWLRRPVPEGGVVWTDKVYPYGSTRGGELRTHTGVEFNVPTGTPIFSAATGTVVFAGPDDGVLIGPQPNFYGNAIVVQHEFQLDGQPVYTVYGHLSEVYVVPDQRVEAEDVIGLSGGTGVADGPHLHFEVRVGANEYGSTRNPLLWLYPFTDYGTIAGRVIWPDGSPAYEAPVSAARVDAQSPYRATTAYADKTVNPDTGWRENFVLDDIQSGFWTVTVQQGDKKYTEEVWVYPYQTSFVEIVLDTPDPDPNLDLGQD